VGTSLLEVIFMLVILLSVA